MSWAIVVAVLLVASLGYLLGRFHVAKKQASQALELSKEIQKNLRKKADAVEQRIKELPDPKAMSWDQKLDYVLKELGKVRKDG